MTAQDKTDLLAFLRSLTDSTLLTSPRFADPWRRP
jgi:cytochrome c peroxidase